jgi:hypothetical protein
MLNAIKQQSNSLTHGHAGRRFEDRHEAAVKARLHAGWADRVRRLLHLIVALVQVTDGVLLIFLPGPAVLFFCLGAACWPRNLGGKRGCWTG